LLSNSAYIIGMTSLPCLAARIFHDNPSITIDKTLIFNNLIDYNR